MEEQKKCYSPNLKVERDYIILNDIEIPRQWLQGYEYSENFAGRTLTLRLRINNITSTY